MFGTAPIDDNAARMAAVRAALKTAMPSRVHKTNYLRDISEHRDHELKLGVVMLVAGIENDFSAQPGMEAREGTLAMVLVIQFEVGRDADGEAVETQELAISSEIKTFVRAGVAGIGLTLGSIQMSAQQETPYGYVVAQLNAGPPLHNLN